MAMKRTQGKTVFVGKKCYVYSRMQVNFEITSKKVIEFVDEKIRELGLKSTAEYIRLLLAKAMDKEGGK